MRSVQLGLLTLGLASLTTLATPEQAHAVYEVCNPYTLQQFRDQMAAMEKAFEDFDLNEARYQAETAEKMARCINEPVTPEDIGRFARDRAQMYFFDSKTENAAEWMMVSLGATGSDLPDEIGEENPLRLVLREVMIEEVEKVSYDGNALPPSKGVVLLNGRVLQQPTGYEGVKGLVQVFDKKGEYVEGFWLSGADWNGEVEKTFVSADAGEYKTPKWFEGPSHTQAPDLLAAYSTVTGMQVEGGGDEVPDVVIPDPKDVTDPVVADPTDGDPTDGSGDAGDNGDPDGLAVGPKPPKPPKGPKPPKTPGDGPNTGLLSTGLGVAAVGGALYGIGAAINGGTPDTYSGSELAGRRSTVNALGTSGVGLMAVGVGLFSVSFVADGGSLRFGRRF